MISGWVFLLILLGIQVTGIAIYMIGHFWPYIPIYKSSRIAFPILFTLFLYGLITLWKNVILDIMGIYILVWPDPLLQLLIVSYIGLFIFYGFCIHLYGEHFLRRMKYRNLSRYGPIMTFNKSDASSLLLKYWVKSKPDGKEILHPADLERKMNLIHQKFSVTPLSQDYPKFDKINRFFSKYKAQIYELTEFQIEEPYSFIVVGDLHAGGNKIEPFVKIISENYLDSRFILALGDSVSDSQHKIHWKAFLGQMEPILSQLPIIAIPGNHDGYAIKRYNNWRLIFDQDYPEPEKGGFHSIYLKHTCIILLDNYNGSHMYTKISPEQANWFDAELEKASDNSQIKQIFVAMHHPPFSTGEAGCDPQLGPFFEARVNKYPKIKIIFAGHCHLYQRFEVKTEEKKINYIVSGGGGGVLDKWIMKKWTGRPYYWESNGHMQNLKFDLDTPKKHPLRNDLFIKNHHVKSIIKNHFLIVKIAQDQIEIKVRSWDNEEIESFTIS